jgi:hypothetical protein
MNSSVNDLNSQVTIDICPNHLLDLREMITVILEGEVKENIYKELRVEMLVEE